MTKRDEYVPKRLKEVWEWKDSIYREVAHFPVEEGLKRILEKAAETSRHFPHSSDIPPKDDKME